MNGMRCSTPQMRTWLLPLTAAIWNQAVYYGGGWLAQERYHHDWTLLIDRAIPFLPWTVSIYLLCFLFWAGSYVLSARQKKLLAYRFFCADFLAKAVCLACFLLLPTTNVRPAVEGNGLWEGLVRFLYQVDAPVNLFPSVHCLVSWLCWIGVREREDIPRWYRYFSFWIAVAICLSTLTIKQHVIVDVAGGIALAEASWWAAGLEPVFRKYAQTADRFSRRIAHVLPVRE